MRAWQVGDVIAGRFDVQGRLGHGSFADVLAVRDRQDGGLLKALKLLRGPDASFERELAAARRAAGHGRLLVADEGLRLGDQRALVLPCSRGMLLADWLQAQPDPRRCGLLMQSLVLLTADLHGLGVAHDDLGFGNVMVTTGAGDAANAADAAELIDFGSSVCSDGPPAPARERPNAFYGRRAAQAGFKAVCADDVRALAILTALALTRRHPFCEAWQALLGGQWSGPDPFLGPPRDTGLTEPLAACLHAALGPAEGRPGARALAAGFDR